MTITPLYTAEELDAEIALAKKDLTAARRALASMSDTGGSRSQVQRAQIESIQKNLEWLQQQRVALGTASGPQSVQGRVYRG